MSGCESVPVCRGFPRGKHRRHNFRVVGRWLVLIRSRRNSETVKLLRDASGLFRFGDLFRMVVILSACKDCEALSAELDLARNVIVIGCRKDTDTLTSLFDVACLFTKARILQLPEDEELRRTMGRNARATIEETFSLDACVARHEAMYAELLTGHHLRGVQTS